MDADALKAVPIFAGLSNKAREIAAQHADEVTLEAGETLVKQGAVAHEFFVVLDGTVDIVIDDELVKSIVAETVIGEIGVLETHYRTATVVAKTPVRFIVMDGRALRALADTEPGVYEELKAIIDARPGR